MCQCDYCSRTEVSDTTVGGSCARAVRSSFRRSTFQSVVVAARCGSDAIGTTRLLVNWSGRSPARLPQLHNRTERE